MNMRELIIGRPNKLRYTWRFNTSRISHPENVAEHSYYVTLYALIIAEWCLTREIKVDCIRLLRRALVHDLEESITGDFPRPFKYSSEELKDSLDKAGLDAIIKISEAIWNQGEKNQNAFCSENQNTLRMQGAWKHAKDDSFEGRIIAFSDFLAALSFLYEEACGYGASIKEHVFSMREYFVEFLKPKYDFMRPLIEQTGRILGDAIEYTTNNRRTGQD